MPEFRVVWEIDIDAETPEEAAKEALETLRDPGTECLVFETESCDCGRVVVDLASDIRLCAECGKELNVTNSFKNDTGTVCPDCYLDSK